MARACRQTVQERPIPGISGESVADDAYREPKPLAPPFQGLETHGPGPRLVRPRGQSASPGFRSAPCGSRQWRVAFSNPLGSDDDRAVGSDAPPPCTRRLPQVGPLFHHDDVAGLDAERGGRTHRPGQALVLETNALLPRANVTHDENAVLVGEGGQAAGRRQHLRNPGSAIDQVLSGPGHLPDDGHRERLGVRPPPR